MKNLIIIAFILAFGNCYSQTKDTSKTKQDTARRLTDTTYAIIMTKIEYEFFIDMIRKADEKPSVIRDYIAFINSRTQLLPQPKKEEPKK